MVSSEGSTSMATSNRPALGAKLHVYVGYARSTYRKVGCIQTQNPPSKVGFVFEANILVRICVQYTIRTTSAHRP